MYLLNNAIDIFQDIPLETFVDDDNKMDKNVDEIYLKKYERAVSECKRPHGHLSNRC